MIMKQEEKDLLIEDLCARLPYSTFVYAQNDIDWYESEICTQVLSDIINDDYVVKPYLFPLSNMTEEEMKELLKISNFNSDIDEICYDFIFFIERTSIDIVDIANFISWLNAHHFDYRGLIEKGLAIDATSFGIYDND